MKDKERHGDGEFIEEKQDVIDDVELEEAEEQQGTKLKLLREKLRECETEKGARLDEIQRLKADFLNSKRRLEEQGRRDQDRAAERIFGDLLPIVDSFDMAMSDQATWEKTDTVWRSGIEGIYAQLISLLKRHNIETVGTLGEAFDPTVHEAVTSQAVATDAEVDTVVAILQKGYRRNDTVLRPAKVAVGQHA